jgi:acyl-coenzyme A synthetase/AMP-(fatty) acid ligase/thioesterase domain-containing protein/tetratricopeptide (TPR) repeat protein
MHLQKSLEFYAGWLALWKIGCVYVPLSTHLSEEELKYRIEDSGVKVILATSNHEKNLNSFNSTEVIKLDQEAQIIATKIFSNPKVDLNVNDRAYIIYTSGTEWFPKGVLIKHQGIINCWQSHQEKLNLTKMDTVAQLADIRVDVSIMEMMLAFGAGACLYVNQLSTDSLINELPELFHLHKITTAIMPPTLLRFLVKDKDTKQFFQSSFLELVNLISATEGIEEKDLSIWVQSDIGKKRRVFNGYGPTESTVGMSISEYKTGRVSIGTLSDCFKEMQFFILTDKENGILSQSGSGEICITGPGLAEGYWKAGDINHSKTNEQFICLKNPKNPDQLLRLYKTGDFGEIINGYLYYLGRIKKDFQVEIAGNRVETLSVVNKLKKHEAVKEAVVVKKNMRLVAYVLLADNAARPTVEELRKCITARYENSAEVPSCFYQITIDQLGAAAEGTLKHQLLIKIPLSSTTFKKPRHNYEIIIKETWETLLDYEDIPTNLDFNLLGGYSLLLSEALTKTAAALNIPKIYVKDLPKPLTIESLSCHLFLQKIYLNSFSLLNESNKTLAALPKLFLLPPLVGIAHKEYRALSEKLSKDFQYYAFCVPLLNDTISLEDKNYYLSMPSLSIEKMAYYIVNSIRKIQPVGPYYLAGWSFGGLLAYEITSQLQAQHQEVKFLGLIDSQAPMIMHNMVFDKHALRLINIIKAIARDCGCAEVVEKIGNLITKKYTVLEQITTAFDFIEEQLKLREPFSDQHLLLFKHMMFIARQHMVAIYHYHPSQKINHAKLYKAAQTVPDISQESEEQDWILYIIEKGFESVKIDQATHFTILDDNQFITEFDNNLHSKLGAKSWNLPPKNSKFVKRDSVSDKIYKFSQSIHPILKPIVLTAMNGEGGMGKTSIAADTIQHPNQFYHMRAWFPAHDIAELEAAYINFSQTFSISNQKDPKQCVRAVVAWLENNPGWFLVYDGAINQIELEPYLPQRGGEILITSRDPNWTFNKITIGLLTTVEAEHLIKQSLGQDDNDAADLARELNYFALAIVQACAYIIQSGISIKEFLILLRAAPNATVINLPDDNHHKNLGKIINLTLTAIKHTPGIINILNLCAYVSANDIPRVLLLCIQGGDDEYTKMTKLNGLISILRNYAIISTNPENNTISIHKTTQMIIRSNHNRQQAQLLVIYAGIFLHKCYMDKSMLNLITYSLSLLPHLLALYQHFERLRIHYCHYNTEKFSELNGTAPQEKMINILRDLANVYSAGLNDHASALKFLQRALQIGSLVYEADNPEIAILLDELADQFDNEPNGLEKSKKYHEKALEIFEKKHGKNHVDVAVTCNQLAPKYLAENNYDKAIELYERALKIKYLNYDKIEKNSLILTLTNLGSTYKAKQDYKKALDYYKQAEELAMKLQIFHYLPIIYSNMGNIYRDNEDDILAEEYLKKAVPFYKAIFGEKHPNLTAVYQPLSQLAAKKNQSETESIYINLLNEIYQASQNSDVLIAKNLFELAKTYKKYGHYIKADELLKKVITFFAKKYGEEHPKTANVQYELGLLMQLMDKKLEGVSLCKNIENCLKSMLHSPYHKPVVKILKRYDLLTPEEKIILLSEHEDTSQRWKPIKVQVKKPDNVEDPPVELTETEKDNLAKKYNEQGINLFKKENYAEAIKLFTISLEIRLELYGINHPIVSLTYYNIGSSYLKLHDLNNALSTLEKCIDIDNKICLHPDSNYAKHCMKLGLAYYEAGQDFYLKSQTTLEKALLLFVACPNDHQEINTIKQHLRLINNALANQEVGQAASSNPMSNPAKKAALPAAAKVSVYRKGDKEITLISLPDSNLLPTIVSSEDAANILSIHNNDLKPPASSITANNFPAPPSAASSFKPSSNESKGSDDEKSKVINNDNRSARP